VNENNIVNALNAYDGTQPSLEKTVAVLSEELGPEWTSLIFQELGGLSVELKEKLDHAFNYYASLTAWQEAQSYLSQTEPLDIELMNERLPVLKHWLDFFGQPGQDLYQQLEERVHSTSETSVVGATDDDGGQDTIVYEPDVADPSQSIQQNDENSTAEEQPFLEQDPSDDTTDISVDQIEEHEQLSETPENHLKSEVQEDSSQNEVVDEIHEYDDTPEAFAIHKAEREIILLDDLQSWLSARCVHLGDIEVFAYPYYGMVVDLMRQTSADIQAVLDLENQDIVMQYYPDGLNELKRKKQAIDSDIQMAVENCESDTTALIDEGMDINRVKKALGNLDTSTEVEYAGPAPDGFELMDDEPIDEEAVKKQYEKLEKQSQHNENTDISVSDEKNTSQNNQNGVQRKLSFSLKPKKG
jgi:hypothetical protein